MSRQPNDQGQSVAASAPRKRARRTADAPLVSYAISQQTLEVPPMSKPYRGASSNTPPSNTMEISPQKENPFVSVDYLSFTVPPGQDVTPRLMAEICRIPGCAPEYRDYGGYGYKRSLKVGPVVILYDGCLEAMGVHVQLSGEACKRVNLFNVMEWVVRLKGKFTRIDLCTDDFDGLLDLDRIEKAGEDGQQLGKFRKGGVYKSFVCNHKESLGKTVSFGGRKSNVYCRFYDKRLEQIHVHGVDPATLPPHWLRMEFEFKHEQADRIARAVLRSRGGEAAELLFGYAQEYLSFREPSLTDSNKSRWAVAAWWSDYVNRIKGYTFKIAREVADLSQKFKWFKRQVSRSFALLLMSQSYGPDAMEKLFLEARNRLRPGDLELIHLHDNYEPAPPF